MDYDKLFPIKDVKRVLEGNKTELGEAKGPMVHVIEYDEAQGNDLYRGRADLGDVETCLILAVLSAYPLRPRRLAVQTAMEAIISREVTKGVLNIMLKRSVDRGYLEVVRIREQIARGRDGIGRLHMAFSVTPLGLAALRSSMARFVRGLVIMEEGIHVRSWLHPDWPLNYPEVDSLLAKSLEKPVRVRPRPGRAGRPAGIRPGMPPREGGLR